MFAASIKPNLVARMALGVGLSRPGDHPGTAPEARPWRVTECLAGELLHFSYASQLKESVPWPLYSRPYLPCRGCKPRAIPIDSPRGSCLCRDRESRSPARWVKILTIDREIRRERVIRSACRHGWACAYRLATANTEMMSQRNYGPGLACGRSGIGKSNARHIGDPVRSARQTAGQSETVGMGVIPGARRRD